MIAWPEGCSKILGAGAQHTRLHLFVGEAMSVQAISWVIEHSKHKGNSFVVLLMIANHARSDGTGAWPSVKTLAKESRVAERTIQRTINRLGRWQHGFDPELIVEKGKGPHGCNLYTIPGVKLSPQPRHLVHTGVSDTVTPPVSLVSPEPSFNRPSTEKERVLLLRFKEDETGGLRCKDCNAAVSSSRAALKHHRCARG
jgi:hypothetical protein